MGKRNDPMNIKSLLKLYFIMGSPNCILHPVDTLAAAIAGGITVFQFREKGAGALQGEEKFRLAKELQRLCRERGIPFLVDDDVDLALALDADGVHVGQEDEPVSQVRERIGNKILGVSVHNLEEAKAALEQGADYLGVGPMYETRTKLDAGEAFGPSLIRHLRLSGIEAPIVGIGGISGGRAAEVMKAGADGIAVISAICQAPSPEEAARALLAEVNRIEPQ